MNRPIFIYIILFSFPLFSYSNPIDTSKIISWKLNETHDTIRFSIDSLLFEFQQFYPASMNSISNTMITNNGQATHSNIFESYNSSLNEPYFVRSYWPFITNVSDIKFYNTKSPYTEIFYSNGQKKDYTLKVIHTQNINKYFNFSLQYNLAALDGNLKRQRSRDNSVSVSTNYSGTRYSQYSALIWNKFKSQISGGILSDSLFEYSAESPQTIEVKLNNASTNVDKRSAFLLQKLNLFKYYLPEDSSKTKPLFYSSVSHSVSIDLSAKTYNDVYSSYYKQWNNDSLIPLDHQKWQSDTSVTKDSVSFRVLKSSLIFKINDNIFKVLPVGLKVGASYEINKYEFYGYDTSFNNTRIEAAFFNESGNSFNFETMANYYISGYQKGYVSANVMFKKYLLNKSDSCWVALSGEFNQGQPDIYLTRYGSNNFLWDSTFQKVTNSKARFDFVNKKYKLNFSVVYSLLDNMIFFDTLAQPKQLEGDANVLSLILNKNFNIWKIHLNNYIIYQKPSSSEIRIPDVVLYNSLYINIKPFNGKLPTNIGFDVFYYSYYHGYDYMPATNIFYLQDKRKLGGHPYVDFFISVQRKKVRLFLKAEHVSALLSKRNYYTAPHYPANGFGIRFGLSWRFSD